MVTKVIDDAEKQVRYIDQYTLRQLGGLEFNEFYFRHVMHSEKAAERQRSRMVSAAFVGWQLGAGKDKQSFNGYLKHMGLMEEKEGMTEEEKQHTIARAKHADDVCRKWFKKNVKGENG